MAVNRLHARILPQIFALVHIGRYALLAETRTDPRWALSALGAFQLCGDPFEGMRWPAAMHDGRQQLVRVEHHHPPTFAIQAQRVAVPGVVAQAFQSLATHPPEHGRNK